MFFLTMHSTHFIYGYMASDIWLRTILIVRKEICCHHIGYSYRLTARVLLYAPSHRQDNTYHGLCYTSCGALAGTRNGSMGPPHEGSIRRPIAPWANTLPLSYIPLLTTDRTTSMAFDTPVLRYRLEQEKTLSNKGFTKVVCPCYCQGQWHSHLNQVNLFGMYIQCKLL